MFAALVRRCLLVAMACVAGAVVGALWCGDASGLGVRFSSLVVGAAALALSLALDPIELGEGRSPAPGEALDESIADDARGYWRG